MIDIFSYLLSLAGVMIMLNDMPSEDLMARLLNLIKKEIWSIIPAVIYFAVCFNLIYFNDVLLLRHSDVLNSYDYWTVNIGALVAGKIIIIVNTFPFLNAYQSKPLIYNILWKFFIYAVFVLLFRIADNWIRASLHFDSWSKGWSSVVVKLQSSPFWSTEMWLFLLFFLFIFHNELVDKIGRDKVRKILFSPSFNKEM
jgi:hypothetical protein